MTAASATEKQKKQQERIRSDTESSGQCVERELPGDERFDTSSFDPRKNGGIVGHPFVNAEAVRHE